MRKISLIVIGLLALPVGADLFARHSLRQSRPSSGVGVIKNRSTTAEYQAGVVLVKLKWAGGVLGKGTTGDASLDAALEPYGVREVRQLFPRHRPPEHPGGVDLSRFVTVEYTSPLDPSSLAEELNKHPAVEYAEPKYVSRIEGVPNDSLYSSQWHLPVIKAAEAWDITQGSAGVIIAIVDTGTDWNHPDLKDNIWVNPGEIPVNGVDDDNNGFVDDVVGWDFSGADFKSPDNDPSPGPSHGTHVAGIASAVTDNGIGISGVGFRCRLMVLKTTADASDENRIFFGNEGIVYAADNGADVINCSWGSNASSQFARDVVQYATDKGSLVVGAAGNENSDEDHFPSGYPHVLSVAWVNQGDTKSFFSNFGPGVDVSAPGQSILSTFPNGQYGTLSGTSMSSPVAAGVAALVKTLHPDWTPDQVGEQVRVSSDPIDELNPSFVRQIGFGRVNALRALTVVSPSVRLTNFSLNDAAFGDGDGILEPGETVQVVAEFTNYLEGTTNTSVDFTASGSLVTIENAKATLGPVGTLESRTNAANPFLFTISPSAPENSSVLFTLLINDGLYQDYSSFRVQLNPTYLNHNVNNIVMTVTSKGTLAFDDFPTNALGDGFIFRRGTNLLFEGAFMAATSSGGVVDVSRDESGITQSGDFQALDKLTVLSPGSVSDQETYSRFSDEQAGSNIVGLTVALRTYAFRNAPDNDYIILRYAIHNTSGSLISRLYTGLYFDWDLGSVLRNSA
ncbi:MAG TPA: S8 family peptidase, partial [Bacteroidota bacterium]